jgi:phage-related protein
MKNIIWLGNSKKRIDTFSKEVRRAIGFELYSLQVGEAPSNYKPMPSIGLGVNEIKLSLENQYRVIYVAKFEEAIYILHSFIKKTQKTAPLDLELTKKNYQELLLVRRKK